MRKAALALEPRIRCALSALDRKWTARGYGWRKCGVIRSEQSGGRAATRPADILPGIEGRLELCDWRTASGGARSESTSTALLSLRREPCSCFVDALHLRLVLLPIPLGPSRLAEGLENLKLLLVAGTSGIWRQTIRRPASRDFEPLGGLPPLARRQEVVGEPFRRRLGLGTMESFKSPPNIPMKGLPA